MGHNFVSGFTQHAAVKFGSMGPTDGRILLTLVGADQNTDSIQITRSVMSSILFYSAFRFIAYSLIIGTT